MTNEHRSITTEAVVEFERVHMSTLENCEGHGEEERIKLGSGSLITIGSKGTS